MPVLQAQVQHPVEHQCQEADQRMGANLVGFTVVDGGDLDFGLELTP